MALSTHRHLTTATANYLISIAAYQFNRACHSTDRVTIVKCTVPSAGPSLYISAKAWPRLDISPLCYMTSTAHINVNGRCPRGHTLFSDINSNRCVRCRADRDALQALMAAGSQWVAADLIVADIVRLIAVHLASLAIPLLDCVRP